MKEKRVFIQLSYKGTSYSGWQIQPNAYTVQEEIETALTKLYNEKVAIVGCGRTDTGVHATMYYCHVDLNQDRFENKDLAYKLNGILSDNIAVQNILDVSNNAHARFDATQRAYFYRLHFEKQPFNMESSFRFNQSGIPDFELLQKAADLITNYKAFYPFCKANTEVETYNCKIFYSYWEQTTEGLKYHVSANRFLRGMVRMLVGMSLNVATNKIKIEEVKKALDNQTRLHVAWSVPPHGLFLSDVKYPYL